MAQRDLAEAADSTVVLDDMEQNSLGGFDSETEAVTLSTTDENTSTFGF